MLPDLFVDNVHIPVFYINILYLYNAKQSTPEHIEATVVVFKVAYTVFTKEFFVTLYT
jgi:hypothetical protein